MWTELAVVVGALLVGGRTSPGRRSGRTRLRVVSSRRSTATWIPRGCRPEGPVVPLRVRGRLPERADAGLLRPEHGRVEGPGRPSTARSTSSTRVPVGPPRITPRTSGRGSGDRREGPEKLVVIAHSRGACDALAFALGDASFVRDRVEALFLIQGPFGGSGMAEYVIGTGQPMDRQMALRHRIVGNLLGPAGPSRRRRGGPGGDGGDDARGFAGILGEGPRQGRGRPGQVGSKTFYIRSSIHPSRLRFARRAIAWYLQVYHGPSDGMVALADQSLPGLGTMVATIEAGHSDLTHRSPATRSLGVSTKALTRSIVMAVGQPSAELARDQDRTRQVPWPAAASIAERTPSQRASRASRAVVAANRASRQRVGSSPQTVESIRRAIGPCSSSSRLDVAVEVLAEEAESAGLAVVEGRDQASKEVGDQLLASQGKCGGDRGDRTRLDEAPGRSTNSRRLEGRREVVPGPTSTLSTRPGSARRKPSMAEVSALAWVIASR